MRMPTITRRRRPTGFTLIELLVVIAIIAVLVSLTAAAVMKVLGTGPRVTTRSEISQMDASFRAAAVDYHDITYFPSQLKLRNDNNYATTGIEATTSGVLQRMFGKGIIGKTVHWDGNSASSATATYTLEGEECLVFYLGGIPTAPGQTSGCLGFSKNPLDPTAAPVSGVTRYGPYFDFNGGRLQRSTRAGNTNFLVYVDPYGKKPYAFFSNYGGGNDYSDTDCSSLSVAPYYTLSGTTKLYLNPKGIQIISAGEDGVFGPGGLWDPKNGTSNANGRDDLANFSKNQLGYGSD